MNKEILEVVAISESLRDYVESLYYEVNSRKDLLTFAMSKGLTDTESFKKYHEEYKDFYIKYEAAKTELFDICVKPKHYEGNISWNLDFATSTLTIYRG